MNNLVVHLRRFNAVSSWLTEKIRCYFYSLCFWFSVCDACCLSSFHICYTFHLIYIHTAIYNANSFHSTAFSGGLCHESGKQEETENLKRVHVFKENDEEEKETQFSTNETEIKFMEKVVLVRCSWCDACAFNIATWKLVHLKLEHLKLLIWVLVTEFFSVSLSPSLTSSFVAQNNHKIALKKSYRQWESHQILNGLLLLVFFIQFSDYNIGFTFHNHIVLIFQFDYDERKKKRITTNYILPSIHSAMRVLQKLVIEWMRQSGEAQLNRQTNKHVVINIFSPRDWCWCWCWWYCFSCAFSDIVSHR